MRILVAIFLVCLLAGGAFIYSRNLPPIGSKQPEVVEGKSYEDSLAIAVVADSQKLEDENFESLEQESTEIAKPPAEEQVAEEENQAAAAAEVDVDVDVEVAKKKNSEVKVAPDAETKTEEQQLEVISTAIEDLEKEKSATQAQETHETNEPQGDASQGVITATLTRDGKAINPKDSSRARLTSQ